MRIAIIGGGAAGLSSFWALNEYSDHQVELFEADDRLGGHANAIRVQQPGKEACFVDTAFVMLNRPGYPCFWQFLKHLKIPLVKTDTSFSVTRGQYAWGSTTLGALFATPGSLLRARPWQMLFDILRFHYSCLGLLKPDNVDRDLTVGEYLEINGYSEAFKDDYLLPLAATYWSLPPARVVADCPIATLVRNFHNHGLLQLFGRPTWYTVRGGSRTYVEAIAGRVRGTNRIHTSCSVTSVSSREGYALVTDAKGVQNRFDHVILATHADITLKLLRAGGGIAPAIERALSAIEWSHFEIVMHGDTSLMPSNENVWGAWNTLLPDSYSSKFGLKDCDQSVSCTFDMNRLHNLPIAQYGHIMGTLNPPHPVDSSKVYGKFAYSTPIFTQRLLDSHAVLQRSTEAAPHISLVGAWTGLGTHEDAWRSGLQAAQRLGASLPFAVDQTADRPVQITFGDWIIAYVLHGIYVVGRWLCAIVAQRVL